MKTEEIKKLLAELQVKPLKSLGQNFLIDSSIIEKICTRQDLNKFNEIIEIGPGLGSLTNNFEEVKDKVKLVELDRSFAAYWKDRGFEVFHTDALKYPWSEVSSNSILLSNLPYQISSRLLIELFCVGVSFESMILMFQKEVGDRIRSTPEDKKVYGLLSIICDLCWSVKTVTKAPNRCFYPPPEIESIVLEFTPKKFDKDINRKAFVNHIKSLFAARRKKINTTFRRYDLSVGEEYKDLLQMRPDQIDAETHLKLFKEVHRG